MVGSLKLFLKGIVLGVSNVIPGVSGGTMAVVLNVYDKILSLITINVKKIFSQWRFWIPLALGMIFGILAFSRLITFLLAQFPIPTKFFFIGLILGSVPLLIKKIRKSIFDEHSQSNEKTHSPLFFVSLAFFFLLGLFLVLSMLFFGADENAKEAAKSVATPSSLSLQNATPLFLAGMAAAIAMIIPGVSGSFLLLALGLYGNIMNAISRLDALYLSPFALGVLLGIILGSALVRLLLKKASSQTYAAILGLVTGSVALIFPSSASFFEILVSIPFLLMGGCTAYFSSRNE